MQMEIEFSDRWGTGASLLPQKMREGEGTLGRRYANAGAPTPHCPKCLYLPAMKRLFLRFVLPQLGGGTDAACPAIGEIRASRGGRTSW